jgi:hypothetical protein
VIEVSCRAPEKVGQVGSAGNQAAFGDKPRPMEDWQPLLGCARDDQVATVNRCRAAEERDEVPPAHATAKPKERCKALADDIALARSRQRA